jgi:hypothetical protein
MLKTVKKLKNSDFIKWFTGFWEGEGCIQFNNSGRTTPTPTLSVYQSELDIIKYIYRHFNIGTISKRGKNKLSKNGGYHYYIGTYYQVAGLLYLMQPYIKSKKRQNQIKKAIKNCKLQSYIKRFSNV